MHIAILALIKSDEQRGNMNAGRYSGKEFVVIFLFACYTTYWYAKAKCPCVLLYISEADKGESLWEFYQHCFQMSRTWILSSLLCG